MHKLIAIFILYTLLFTGGAQAGSRSPQAQSLVEKATASMLSGDYSSALNSFQLALQIDNEDVGTAYQIAICLEKIEAYANALEFFEWVYFLDPLHADVAAKLDKYGSEVDRAPPLYLVRAAKEFDQKNYEEAINLLSEYVSVYPEDHRAWVLMARACHYFGATEAAELSFARAMELAPDPKAVRQIQVDLATVTTTEPAPAASRHQATTTSAPTTASATTSVPASTTTTIDALSPEREAAFQARIRKKQLARKRREKLKHIKSKKANLLARIEMAKQNFMRSQGKPIPTYRIPPPAIRQEAPKATPIRKRTITAKATSTAASSSSSSSSTSSVARRSTTSLPTTSSSRTATTSTNSPRTTAERGSSAFNKFDRLEAELAQVAAERRQAHRQTDLLRIRRLVGKWFVWMQSNTGRRQFAVWQLSVTPKRLYLKYYIFTNTELKRLEQALMLSKSMSPEPRYFRSEKFQEYLRQHPPKYHQRIYNLARDKSEFVVSMGQVASNSGRGRGSTISTRNEEFIFYDLPTPLASNKRRKAADSGQAITIKDNVTGNNFFGTYSVDNNSGILLLCKLR